MGGQLTELTSFGSQDTLINDYQNNTNTKEKIVNCSTCSSHPCLPSNSESMLKINNKRIYNYVRVPTSLYTGSLAAVSTYTGSFGGIFGLRWNQSSDKILPHLGRITVPSRGNSTRSSITRNRPGAMTPGGIGVDIKHNSYQRYLNRKKGRTVPSGTYVANKVNPNSVVNNKVQKASIVNSCPKNIFCSF
tara:strand:- start:45 stop:614 length:570 start_codon:yes stop_codon:yes gene_type:complete